MFCIKCGKGIEEESVFCEFCGTKQVKMESTKEIASTASEPVKESKVETAAKVSKEITNLELKKIADHLEFLGYEIEKLDTGEGREYIAARPATGYNYIFHEMTPDFILFQVSLRTEKKQDSGMGTAVNRINKALGLSRFYYDIGEEDGLVMLRIEAVYVGLYLKEKFARFQDRFEKEQEMVAQLEETKVFMND